MAQSLNTKKQDDDIPKEFFIQNFRFQNGGLVHVTINFDSLFRRLLASTTKTDYIAPSLSSMRTQTYKCFSTSTPCPARNQKLETNKRRGAEIM